MAAQKTAPRAWQRMLSGRRLDLLQPSSDDIAIEDIAHGLARVARWNGQTRGRNPLSVAQHCLLVESIAALLDPAITFPARLAALLHDAPEYVIGDLISPFKTVMGEAYRSVERRLLGAIHLRFSLAPPTAAVSMGIKHADQIAAYEEATQLAGFSMEEAARLFVRPDADVAAAIGAIEPQEAPVAERAFLARFETLQTRCP